MTEKYSQPKPKKQQRTSFTPNISAITPKKEEVQIITAPLLDKPKKEEPDPEIFVNEPVLRVYRRLVIEDGKTKEKMYWVPVQGPIKGVTKKDIINSEGKKAGTKTLFDIEYDKNLMQKLIDNASGEFSVVLKTNNESYSVILQENYMGDLLELLNKARKKEVI